MMASTGPGQATPVLDQNNAAVDVTDANTSLEWQQQVTAGVTGLLAGITL
jgi:predicted secreted protein